MSLRLPLSTCLTLSRQSLKKKKKEEITPRWHLNHPGVRLLEALVEGVWERIHSKIANQRCSVWWRMSLEERRPLKKIQCLKTFS